MLIMLRIKKLDIFITKQFGLLFVGTFFICQFVLMMQFLWRYVDELIGKGLSLDIMAQFFWYMGLMLLPQALPLAILLSSLIVFGAGHADCRRILLLPRQDRTTVEPAPPPAAYLHEAEESGTGNPRRHLL